MKKTNNNTGIDENGTSFSLVTDDNNLEKLNSEKTVKVYRVMQVIDGKLYPPNTRRSIAAWHDSTFLIHKEKFKAAYINNLIFCDKITA